MKDVDKKGAGSSKFLAKHINNSWKKALRESTQGWQDFTVGFSFCTTNVGMDTICGMVPADETMELMSILLISEITAYLRNMEAK